MIFQDFPGPGILKKKKSRNFQDIPEAWKPCESLCHQKNNFLRGTTKTIQHQALPPRLILGSVSIVRWFNSLSGLKQLYWFQPQPLNPKWPTTLWTIGPSEFGLSSSHQLRLIYYINWSRSRNNCLHQDGCVYAWFRLLVCLWEILLGSHKWTFKNFYQGQNLEQAMQRSIWLCGELHWDSEIFFNIH